MKAVAEIVAEHGDWPYSGVAYVCLKCEAMFSYPPHKIGEENKNEPYINEDNLTCPFCNSKDIKDANYR